MKTKYQLIDERLVYGFINKKKETFSDLYEAYAPFVYKLLVRWVKDEELAADLLQDTFVKVWVKANSFDPTLGSLYTWVTIIAKRLTLTALKSQQVHVQIDQSIYPQSVSQHLVGIVYNYKETLPLSQLAPKYKEIIQLLYYQSYTLQEIADHLRLPLGTVKTRHRVALQQLKCHYKSDITQFYN